MQNQKHSFVYFLAWLSIGTVLGLAILFYRGDIQLASQQAVSMTITPKNIRQYKHTGYADAVMKAAPAVVSIRTLVWTTVETDTNISNQALQRFWGRNHRTGQSARLKPAPARASS